MRARWIGRKIRLRLRRNLEFVIFEYMKVNHKASTFIGPNRNRKKTSRLSKQSITTVLMLFLTNNYPTSITALPDQA